MKLLAPFIIFLFFIVCASAQIVVDEGELVKLKLSAKDQDGDPITYSFSEPLDENGEWQTNYNDAGDYETEVTASDGKDTTTKKVTITVNNVNQAPDLSWLNNVEVTEGERVDLKLKPIDQDGDSVRYEISEPVGNDGIMETSFKDAGIYNINIKADDGKFASEKTITLKINDIDRAPTLDSSGYKIIEGSTFRYSLPKQDPDGDPIKYTVKGLPQDAKIIDNEIVWQTSQDTLRSKSNVFKRMLFQIGAYKPKTSFQKTYNVEITADSKGKLATSTLTLVVENSNRAPTLEVPQKIEVLEGDKIKLSPVAYDNDGDPVRIRYSGFMITNLKNTGYDDAGNYEITVTASDGSLKVSKNIELEIMNNNRLPFLEPNSSKIYENEESVISLNAKDLDKDNVEIDESFVPEGVIFNKQQSTLTITPSYDFVAHNKEDTKNFFIRMLNRLFAVKNHEKDLIAKMELYDGLNTTQRDYTIRIKDVNRAPIMNRLEPMIVREGERLFIPVDAQDPDGDSLRYKFSGLIRRNNQTIGYNKEGEQTQKVIVSDGSLETSVEVPITVVNTNRAPTLKLTDKSLEENSTIIIELEGIDPDKDNISYILKTVPDGMILVNNTLNWTPSFDFVSHNTNNTNSTTREFIYEIEVKDNFGSSLIANATLFVKDIDRKPEIITFSPKQRFITEQGKVVDFFVSASDPDGDKLKYFWGDERIEGDNTNTRKLIAVGMREFSVEISDGVESITFTWPYITRAKK